MVEPPPKDHPLERISKRLRIGNGFKSPALNLILRLYNKVPCSRAKGQHSKRGHKTMEQILKLYPNDVKLVIKHFPLPFQKHAGPAARAAWAAEQQGKSREFQEVLFSQQEKLSDPAGVDTFFT